MDEDETYDVVVVGGGAAGLSSAVALARSRRRVVVVDAGEPRNAPADGVHNYLGREGISPLELLEVGRTDLASYGGVVRRARAVGARRLPDGITVDLDDGGTLTGRRLVLAGGVVDVLPEVDGLAQRWGRDVVHCPFCHGWEVRDRRIGVLASSPMATHQAVLFSRLTNDLVVLVHDAELDPEDRTRLVAAGARLQEGRVAGLVVEDDRLAGVRFEDGSVLPLEVLAVQSRLRVRREVVDALGVEVAEHPSGMGEHVPVDATGRTNVPGVLATGNLTDLGMQVMGAAAAGTRAGAMAHAELIEVELAASTGS